MGRKVLIILFFSFGTSGLCTAQEIWTIGPMVHVNFGGGEIHVSYALETAYWNYTNFPYSIDGALEFESGKFRIYSEFQSGIAVAGISCGPVFELSDGAHFGFQSSIWGNYFLGGDFRLRWINKTTYKCIGAYLKIPIGPGTSGGSSYGNSYHSYSHHHHH